MSDLKNELEQIFDDIPRDGSNVRNDNDDDNGYDGIENKAAVSFEEKVVELKESLGDSPSGPSLREPSPEKPIDPEKLLTEVLTETVNNRPTPGSLGLEESSSSEESEPGPAKEETEEVIEEAMDGMEAIPVIETTEEPKEKAEEPSKDTDGEGDNNLIEAEKTSQNDNGKSVEKADIYNSTDGIETWITEGGWKLDAPTIESKFLYDKKSQYIDKMLVGGVLIFDKWQEELISLYVDMNNVTYDTNVLYERLQEIQKMKHRVQEITNRVLAQYYLWKRFIDLFRGMSGSAENAKGAAVNAAALKHIPDFELYWCRLESTYEQCKGVMKNLDSAHECVSRQVTIALPDRAIERYHQQNIEQPVQSYQEKPPHLEGYDELGQPDIEKDPSSEASDMGWDQVVEYKKRK